MFYRLSINQHGCINDFFVNADGLVSKFPDDTNIGGITDSEGGCQKMQWDTDQLQKWTDKWQIEFNWSKHLVLPFGRLNVRKIVKMIPLSKKGAMYVHHSV